MSASERPQVRYCGFTDRANIGDFALFEANRRLMPRLNLLGTVDRPVANLFGGGTALPYSLRYGRFPRSRINLALGVGVEDPAFAGRFGPATIAALHWWRFKRIGVRGDRSRRILAAHGIKATVTGDTALALSTPVPSRGSAETVGISLVGEPMDRRGDRDLVLRHAVDFGKRALAAGLQVTLVPFCRTDVELTRALETALDGQASVLDFWSSPTDEDLDLFLAELARMRFIVAERLHAAVLSAAVNVPFLMLPYKPKCLDFLETLPEDGDAVLDYARLSGDAIWRIADRTLRDGSARRTRMTARVDELRTRLRSAANDIEEIILAAAGPARGEAGGP